MISESETWSEEKLSGIYSSQHHYHQSISDHGAPGVNLLLQWAVGLKNYTSRCQHLGNEKNCRSDSAARYTSMKQEQVRSWAQFCCFEVGLWWEPSLCGLTHGLVLPALLLQCGNPGRSRCLCGLGWEETGVSNTDGYQIWWPIQDMGSGKNIPFLWIADSFKKEYLSFTAVVSWASFVSCRDKEQDEVSSCHQNEIISWLRTFLPTTLVCRPSNRGCAWGTPRHGGSRQLHRDTSWNVKVSAKQL